VNENATGPWVIAGSELAITRLEPLLAARRKRGEVRVWTGDAAEFVARPAKHLPKTTAGVLVVGDRRRSPGRMLPGLFLHENDGRPVPAGWLPDVGAPLATYARAAARVLERSADDRSLVVLGQWEDRFLRVGLRAERWMEKHGHADGVFNWTADRISRTDMLAGLRHGPAVAVYFGHGRPRGWAGYHGVRTAHFERPWDEPVAALLALCCENASRHHTGLSFAERLVLTGVCGAMLAAVTKTRHEDNRRWGPELCEAFTEKRPETLAGLVTGAGVPARLKTRTAYRFIGDPLMPLAGAEGAGARAAKVFAPAPDEALPPWEDVPA
jgi:hypothetical protein